MDSQNLSFDLAAVRYIITPGLSEVRAFADNDETKWSSQDLTISLGEICLDEPRKQVTVDLAEPMEIDSIHLVGSLACSTDIAQGTKVLEVKMVDIEGQSKSNFLRAGQDLSEFAINRADVASQVKHQAAKIFKQTPIEREKWLANTYVTKVLFTQSTVVKQLKFELPLENTGAMIINKISLNNSRLKTSTPFLSNRWQYIEDVEKIQFVKIFIQSVLDILLT